MRPWRTAPLFPALLALALATPAAAQERVIRFGLTGDYPPFAERRPDGSLAGADIVIARKIANRLGAKVEFVLTNWQGLAADFAAGRFDVVLGGLTVTPERAALGTFSVPLMRDGKRPLSRCADKSRYRSVAAIDRAGVRVQINRGRDIGALAKGWFRHASVTVNPDDSLLSDAVLAGRADVWITDGVVVDHMARRYRGKLCSTISRPFTQISKAWLIRSDPPLVAAINAGLRRALKDGSWRKALEAVP